MAPASMGSSLRCATSVGMDGSRLGSFLKKASCGAAAAVVVGGRWVGMGVGRLQTRASQRHPAGAPRALPVPDSFPLASPHLLHGLLDGQVLQEAGRLRQPVAQHPRLQQRLGVEAAGGLGGQQALVVRQQLLWDPLCAQQGTKEAGTLRRVLQAVRGGECFAGGGGGPGALRLGWQHGSLLPKGWPGTTVPTAALAR
jgi:hypothetical protein